MDLLSTKILSMVLLGGGSLIIGGATWGLSSYMDVSRQGRKRTIATSLLLCFGAGVMLATSLLHILPEAREGLEEKGEELKIEWLAELCFFLGFFLVYLVEEMVHLVLQFTQHEETVHRTFSMRKSGAEHDDDEDGSSIGSEENCCQNTMNCHNDMELGKDEANNTTYQPKHVQVEVSMKNENGVKPKSMEKQMMSPTSSNSTTFESIPPNSHSHVVFESNSMLKDIITVLALSFHAVFEGMAVGLEKEIGDVWKLFVSIAVHKFVITFCVCVELLQSKTRVTFYFVYLSTFALVSSIGVGIGLAISNGSGAESEGQELLIGVMQALAGGTIIYVVMFEVLQREKSKDVAGIPQLLAVLLGFAAILIIEIFGAHHHHEHGHEAEEDAVRRMLNSTAGNGGLMDNGSPFNTALKDLDHFHHHDHHHDHDH